jgi:hypothetical protein
MTETHKRDNDDRLADITTHLQKGYSELLELLQQEDISEMWNELYINNLHDASKELYNLMNKINP